MSERVQKVKIEELETVRLDFGDGEIHEMPISNVNSYAKLGSDANSRRLMELADAICHFSNEGASPAIEFVIPVSNS